MLQEASKRFYALAEDEANQAIASMNLAHLELYERDFEAAYVVGGLRAREGQDESETTTGASAPAARSASPPSGSVAVARREQRLRSHLIACLHPTRRDHEVLSTTLTGIALAADTQSARPAARLLGAVRRLNDDAAFRHGPRWLELEAVLARPLTDALGADEYARELSIGAALDREEAITLAQSLLGRPSDIP